MRSRWTRDHEQVIIRSMAGTGWIVVVGASLGACATAPIAEAPTPVVPAKARVRRMVPAGMFVSDLMGHRIGGDGSARRVRVRLAAECVDESCLAEPVVFAAGPTRVSRMPLEQGRTRGADRGALPSPSDSPDVTIELCIDDTGTVTSARTNDGSTVGQTAADKARTWRFAPYFVRGKPLAVCSFVHVGAEREPDDAGD